jgi:hypothetical protein
MEIAMNVVLLVKIDLIHQIGGAVSSMFVRRAIRTDLGLGAQLIAVALLQFFGTVSILVCKG